MIVTLALALEVAVLDAVPRRMGVATAADAVPVPDALPVTAAGAPTFALALAVAEAVGATATGPPNDKVSK
jgi:hypothetical protein